MEQCEKGVSNKSPGPDGIHLKVLKKIKFKIWRCDPFKQLSMKNGSTLT